MLSEVGGGVRALARNILSRVRHSRFWRPLHNSRPARGEPKVTVLRTFQWEVAI